MAIADLDLRLRKYCEGQGHVSRPGDWVLVRVDSENRLDEVEEWNASYAQPDEATLSAITTAEVDTVFDALQAEAIAQGGAPTTIAEYSKWYYRQAKNAAENFVHEDGVTGTTLYYDIDPWAIDFLPWLHRESLKHEPQEADVLASRTPGLDAIEPFTHTSRNIEDLMSNVLFISKNVMSEYMQFQQQVLTQPDVDAVRALTLPSWATLP